MKILMGCDPEVFVKKDGVFVSAHGLIPGTKKEPFPVEDGAVQVDGMALEYNIRPASTEDEFVSFNQNVLRQLREMVSDYEIVIEPTATFSKEHFDAQPEEAKMLGCEPDFNAYTGDENEPPDNTTTMRTAAGHLHFGIREPAPIDEEHIRRCITAVKHLDAYLGIPSLLWDADTKRRAMYGKAGCFRPKEYGFEYRPLSNAWLKDERLMRYVYRAGIRCIEQLIEGERFKAYEAYESVINRSGIWEARACMERGNELSTLEKPPAIKG